MASRLLYPTAMYRWSVLFVVGCGLYTGEDPPPEEPAATSYVDVRDAPVHHWLHRMDLVFVIDTTPAMAPLRDRMVANMVRFAAAIEQNAWSGDVDIMAITSDPADGAHLLGDVSHLVSIPAGGFRHDFDGALADRLAALVPSTFTASSSQPLEQLTTALEHDAGFRHERASLVFVPISGRDDESPGSIDAYVSRVQALAAPDLGMRMAPIYTQPASRLDQFLSTVQDDTVWRTDLATEDWTGAMLPLQVKSDLGLPCLNAVPAKQRDCAFSAFYGGVETILPACNATLTNRPCEELRAEPSCQLSEISPREQWLEWPEYGTRVTIQCVVDGP